MRVALANGWYPWEGYVIDTFATKTVKTMTTGTNAVEVKSIRYVECSDL